MPSGVPGGGGLSPASKRVFVDRKRCFTPQKKSLSLSRNV
jgi:hypothetical protein